MKTGFFKLVALSAVIALILVVAQTPPKAMGFFDQLQTSSDATIGIGSWDLEDVFIFDSQSESHEFENPEQLLDATIIVNGIEIQTNGEIDEDGKTEAKIDEISQESKGNSPFRILFDNNQDEIEINTNNGDITIPEGYSIRIILND